MPVEGFYTADEERALVYEYLQLPHGTKAEFLAERGITQNRVRRWRKQVFADTLEVGLVPRVGGVVSADESGALKRLLSENQQLREQLAASDRAHHQELAARDEELACQRRAVDALGKAIEILHPNGASKNSSSNAANDPVNDLGNPSSSIRSTR